MTIESDDAAWARAHRACFQVLPLVEMRREREDAGRLHRRPTRPCPWTRRRATSGSRSEAHLGPPARDRRVSPPREREHRASRSNPADRGLPARGKRDGARGRAAGARRPRRRVLQTLIRRRGKRMSAVEGSSRRWGFGRTTGETSGHISARMRSALSESLPGLRLVREYQLGWLRGDVSRASPRRLSAPRRHRRRLARRAPRRPACTRASSRARVLALLQLAAHRGHRHLRDLAGDRHVARRDRRRGHGAASPRSPPPRRSSWRLIAFAAWAFGAGAS